MPRKLNQTEKTLFKWTALSGKVQHSTQLLAHFKKNIMATALSKKLSKADLLIRRNAAIEHAFQCGITVGHLAHIFDPSKRQINGLEKK